MIGRKDGRRTHLDFRLKYDAAKIATQAVKIYVTPLELTLHPPGSAGVQALSWRRRRCALLLPEHEREHDRDAAEAEEHLHGT